MSDENLENEDQSNDQKTQDDETEKILSELLEEDGPADNLTAMLEGTMSATTPDDVFTGMVKNDNDEQSKPKISKHHKEDMERILKIKVPLQVVLAEKYQSINETINFQVGSLIEFEKHSSEDLDVYINNQQFGVGEVVKVNERFGVRIKNIITLQDKIRSLGV